MHSTDTLIFYALILGSIILGICSYRPGSNSFHYMYAGRTLPNWLLSFSFLATFVHTITFVGYPGGAFRGGWTTFAFVLPVPIIAWAAARWAVPYFRRQKDLSAFAQMEQCFGPATRRYAAVCFIVSQVLRQAVICYMLAMIMGELLGWNMVSTIIIFTLLTTASAVIGGLRGVIWTQAFAGLLLMLGSALCIIVLAGAMPGGIEVALPAAMQDGKFSLGKITPSLTHPTLFLLLLTGIFDLCQRYFIDQTCVQRYNAAVSDNEARHAVINSSWMYVVTTVMLLFIGTMLYCYYSEFTIMMSENVPHDYIFPYFIINQLPMGLSGLLMAILFFSGMAPLTSSIASCSQTILVDLVGRRAVYYGERRRKAILRGSGVAVALTSLALTLLLTVDNGLLNPWWTLSATMAGALVGMLLLCLLVRRASQADTIIAITIGLGVAIWLALWWWKELPGSGLSLYLADIVGAIVTVLTGALLALRHDKTNRELAN